MGSDQKPRPVVKVGPVQWAVSVFAPRFVNPQRVFQTGLFSPLTLALALVLTWATFAAFNRVASGRVDEAFRAGQLEEFRGVAGAAQAEERAVERKWADAKLRGWLRDVLKPPGNNFPASKQAVALFHIPGPGGPTAEERTAAFQKAVTGDRSADWPDGWGQPPRWLAAGLPVSIKSPAAFDVFNEQAEMGGRHWLKAIDAASAAEKKKFAERYVEGVIGMVNGPIRAMRRPNGWVQWLTVLLTYHLVLTAARRWVLVAKLTTSAGRARAELQYTGEMNPDNIVPAGSEVAAVASRMYGAGAAGVPPTGAATEVDQLAASSDTAAYGLYANTAAVIPALGFLGTVIGMGDALLRADGLFSAQDKQRVVGQITQDLGFAFDTTLVSLIYAPLAVVSLAVVRVAERRMFAGWAAVFRESHDLGRAAQARRGGQR